MTARFVALYETPADPAAFEEHYHNVHIPLAYKLPGLRRYTISRDIVSLRGETPYYLLAELDWGTMDELRAAFASPEGRATAEDAAHLAVLAPMRAMIFTAEDAR
ncbi:MAG TPA: EthD family reductase [Pseudonocardiaceae bacterium]|nr:EthD family reductase [Pseudonocardiaceae bacterium]